jgi:hypothetical protein
MTKDLLKIFAELLFGILSFVSRLVLGTLITAGVILLMKPASLKETINNYDLAIYISASVLIIGIWIWTGLLRKNQKEIPSGLLFTQLTGLLVIMIYPSYKVLYIFLLFVIALAK